VDAYRALLRPDTLSESEKIVKLIATTSGRKKASEDAGRAVKEILKIQEEHLGGLKEARADRASCGKPTTVDTARTEGHDHPDDALPTVI